MPRARLWLTGLLLCLHGCGAVLIVPAIATTQELMRDRKGQFERGHSAHVGSYLHVACDFSFSPGKYEACGHLVAVRDLQGLKEYVFEVVPPGCSYSFVVDSHEQIVEWRYVSEPAECWKFYLPPT